MKYEINCYGRWIEVNEDIFQSWTAERKLNGERYIGPRVKYLTKEPISSSQITRD